MLKFFVIISTIIIGCQTLDLPISSGCKRDNSICTSGTECCSGFCRNKICFRPCREIHASCNDTNAICCRGTTCRSYDKICCRLSGQKALTPSECCFSSTRNDNGLFCCSGHAQACLQDTDCCPGMGKCSKSGPWINICL